MITPTLRVYLPDFVGTEQEDEVIEKITSYGNAVPNTKLYFWFDGKKDSVDVQKFIKKWDRLPHNNFKTITRPEFFDRPLDFIWYDIMPRGNRSCQYSRFSWMYSSGVDGVLKGLDNFKSTYDFVSKEKPPKRKQKRNDYEDSDSRE